MSRRLLAAVAALAGLALAAGAVPAFTADSGTVAVSVTAEAAPASCLTVSPEALDYGTLPFSRAVGAGWNGGSQQLLLTNCGTANEHLVVAGTDATGPSGAWALSATLSCEQLNAYSLQARKQAGEPSFQFQIMHLVTKTPSTLADAAGVPYVFAADAPTDVNLALTMPCQGSNGAGEQKSLSVTFTAVVA